MPDKWAAYLEPAEQAPAAPADRWAQFAEPSQPSGRVPVPSLAGPAPQPAPPGQFRYYANLPDGRARGSNDGVTWTDLPAAQPQLPNPADANHVTSFNAQIVAGLRTMMEMAQPPAPPPVPGMPGGVPPGPPPFHVYVPRNLAGKEQTLQGNRDQDLWSELLKIPFVGTGIGQIATGGGELQKPGGWSKAAGVKDIGFGVADVATPFIPGAMAKAPMPTLGTLASGFGAQAATELILKKANLKPEHAETIAGLVGLLGAGWTYRKLHALANLDLSGQANVIEGKINSLMADAKNLSGKALDAARAQIQGLVDGLGKIEAGKPPIGGAAAAGQGQRISTKPAPATEPPQYSITGRPLNEQARLEVEREKQRGPQTTAPAGPPGGAAPGPQRQPELAGGPGPGERPAAVTLRGAGPGVGQGPQPARPAAEGAPGTVAQGPAAQVPAAGPGVTERPPEVFRGETYAERVAKERAAAYEPGRLAARIEPSRMDPETRKEYTRFRELLHQNDDLGFDRNSQAVSAVLGHKDWATRWDVRDPELIRLGNKFGGWEQPQPAAPPAIAAPGRQIEAPAAPPPAAPTTPPGSPGEPGWAARFRPRFPEVPWRGDSADFARQANAKVEVDTNGERHVYVNEPGAILLHKVMQAAMPGMPMPESFHGTTLPAGHAESVIRLLEDNARSGQSELRPAFGQLAGALRDALSRTPEGASVVHIDEGVPETTLAATEHEEAFHRATLRATGGRDISEAVAEQYLRSNASIDRAAAQLRKERPYLETDAEVAEELAAQLRIGEWGKLGLTDAEAGEAWYGFAKLLSEEYGEQGREILKYSHPFHAAAGERAAREAADAGRLPGRSAASDEGTDERGTPRYRFTVRRGEEGRPRGISPPLAAARGPAGGAEVGPEPAPEIKPPTGGFPFVPGSPQGGGHPPPGGPTSSLPPETPGVNRTADIGRLGSEQPPPLTGANLPPTAPRESSASSVTFGTGLGGLEPLFREAKAEGDALRAQRKAALAGIKAAESSVEEKRAGEALRSYFTSERDLWAAKANQALDILQRKILPKVQDREAVAIMREFRHKPQELAAFIDGSHPYLQEADGGPGVAQKRYEKLLPVMRNALRMINDPNIRERTADQVFTNIATESLKEGARVWGLKSRWDPRVYVPHLFHQKGEGELAKLPEPVRRRQGNIGKYFSFGERRQDEYPTVIHGIADGLNPKTLDPVSAFIIHQANFARARATHLLEAQLAEQGSGIWSKDEHLVPDDYVRFAPWSDEWEHPYNYPDAEQGSKAAALAVAERKIAAMRAGRSYQDISAEIGKEIAPQRQPAPQSGRLWTKKWVADALDNIVAPEQASAKFQRVRQLQRNLKEAILGLSGFHLLTENVMAAGDIGPKGMLESFRAQRGSPEFQADERDFIRSGGTTSIQGATMGAYRGLQPGTIPTRGEIWRTYVPGSKQVLKLADDITRLTFDNVQRKFKVVSFRLHRDAWMKENPHATPEQTDAAMRGIASYINGVYGGLHWENLGVSRMFVNIARAGLLAPDWSGSNVLLAKYAAGGKFSARELLPGQGRLAGATTEATAAARLSRAFWAKQIVGGLIATQMLSLMFSGKLSPRPFQVYLGTDPDGREVFLNIAFRGSAGDLVNLISKMEEHGFVEGPGIFLQGKSAPLAKLMLHFITGKDDFGRQIAPKDLNIIANTLRAAGVLIGDISPVPITGRNFYRMFASDGSDRYLWSEKFLSELGPLAQHVTPEGYRMTREGLVPKEEEPDERPSPEKIWQQMWTGKAREGGRERGYQLGP